VEILYYPSSVFGYLMNIKVYLPDIYRNRVAGLFGNFNGIDQDDFITPSGSMASDLFSFHNAWRVPLSENLFLDATLSIPVILGGGSQQAPPLASGIRCNSEPGDEDVTDELQENGANQSPINSTSESSGFNSTCTPASQSVAASANATCLPFFTDSTAACCEALGVSPDPFLDTCLCDFYLTESGEFTLDSVQGFYDACNQELVNQNTTCPTCPRACSNQGTCNSNGTCTCDSGFQGDDCSENLSLPPVIKSVSSQDSNCPRLALIIGENFLGNQIQCVLDGNVVGRATKLSNFQLLCEIPTASAAGQYSISVAITRADGATSNTTSFVSTPTCCDDLCKNQVPCVNTNNQMGFQCQCPLGLAGRLCDQPVPDCPVQTYANARWNSTSPGSLASGVCDPGFSGSPLRTCSARGQWESLVINHCTRNRCSGLTEGNANWPATNSLQQAAGSCASGFLGNPRRLCQADGTFGPIQNPCVDASTTCPSQTFGTASWPSTFVGDVASGTCVSGSPTRRCKVDGTWESLVQNHCQSIYTLS